MARYVRFPAPKKYRLSLVNAAIIAGAVASMVVGLQFAKPTISAADTETSFTLAEVPDTQKEVHSDTNPLLPNRYRWLADNKAQLNLKFIAHTGDLVDWGDVDQAQYIRANNATNILDESGVPYSYALGNHDTGAVTTGGGAAAGNTRENLRKTAIFNSYFPLSRFKNVGGTFEANKVDNMYQTFTAGGLNWMIITLEMWPRTAVIDWAKQVVASHPNHNVVIATHAYTDNSGSRPTTNFYGDNTAGNMWQQLISQYSNIKFTLSGHYGPVNGVGGYSYSEATGVNGNKIAQIMTAYHAQYQNHVRLLNINAANGTISSTVYVPTSINTAFPSGYISDGASNFMTTGMQWVQPITTTPPPPPPTPSAPSEPTNVIATAGNASAQVSFTAPANSGGAPITTYTVTAQPGGATTTGATSPINVSGLANGTAYTFTVTAANSVGISAASVASNSVTPVAPPAATELLPDAGFESGNGGWTAFTIGTLTRVAAPVHGGSSALRIASPSTTTNLVGMTQNSAVTNSIAGKQYTVQCWVQPTGPNLNMTIRLLEYTQNYSSNIKIGTVATNNLPANTWTLLKASGTATASAKRVIPQVYATNQTSGTASVLYDDCSFTSL